jgi:hypothetical protein
MWCLVVWQTGTKVFREHQGRNVSRVLSSYLSHKKSYIIFIIIDSMVHFFKKFVVVQLVEASFVSIEISSRSGLNIFTN